MNILKRFLMAFMVVGFAFTIFACNNTDVGDTPTGDNVGSFGSYDALKDYLTDYLNYYENNQNYDYATTNSTDGLGSEDYGSEVSKQYSQTNNQVEGVDEGDKILTNGNNIFVLSGQQLFIIDSDSLDIVFTYSFENGYFENMYLYGNKLVAIGSYHYYWWGIYGYYGGDAQTEDEKDYSDATTMVEDDTLNPDGSETTVQDTTTAEIPEFQYGSRVLVFDISDLENVNLERELYFEAASITETRMIDGYLYLIMNNYMISYYVNTDLYVPRYKDSAISDEYITLPANRIFFMPDGGASYSYLQLISFNVEDNSPINIKAYLGSTYQIYMSLNNLYTITYNYNYDEIENTYYYHTYVLRFALENHELTYKAIGKISGYSLNQFSMDEYDGVFRIATTEYKYSENKTTVSNQLYLLDATSDNDMTQLSVLENLGKEGETIYAVRFNQEIAYVVTFVQTDPLYKLDLSDPENPVILGELYEDGVSDYLHNISDDLMIGVGRQAETIDGITRFKGVKVSLYDITSDIPVNVDEYLVEGEYSYSNVAYDHKAFIYFAPSGADYTYVAIPVYEYFADEQYYRFSQNEYVFKVYDSGELEFMARLSHIINPNSQEYYGYYDNIERAVFIDNYIYTISYSKIQKYDMNDDFAVTGSTELNTDYYQVYGYPEVAIAVD